MIRAVGTDIVSVERIRKAMEREGFTERVLRKEELVGDLTPEYVAGRWAAKEALVKCLGGVMSDYAVVRGEGGRPEVLGVSEGVRVHLSISHERAFAVAFVVVEEG